jgi:hypothetical protein
MAIGSRSFSMLNPKIKVEGDVIEVDFMEALGANVERLHDLLAMAGLALAGSVRELRRAEAHRAAGRGRALSIASDEHKAWPEWKVKAHVDGADDMLALAEGVVQAGHNVMVMEAFLRVLGARLGLPYINLPSLASPAFASASR